MTPLPHVYFIKPKGRRGPIKIGCSTSSYRRLQQLRTWSPLPLHVLATFPGGKAVERQFHDWFSADRQHGEWFAASAQLEAVIRRIADGTFDRATLPPLRFTCFADRHEHESIMAKYAMVRKAAA